MAKYVLTTKLIILAVKNISTVALSIHEEEQFLDVISNVARLRHPNIITLVGYCVEHGQHLLVYEYVRNWSLEDALHFNVHDRLTWIARIRIALSIARGLEYMHSNCLPPVAHCNLKAANILLDSELMPHLCDCGLAVLRSLTSNSVKLKEQSLVKWASSCLHDYKCLEAMVDPTTRPMISSRSLSRFADIVSLCIQKLAYQHAYDILSLQCQQTEPEFRPTMSEIVESLELLNDRSSADAIEGESFDLSLQTTNTHFISSPVTSYASANFCVGQQNCKGEAFGLMMSFADLTDEGSFEEAVMGCHSVFHTATPVDFASEDPEAAAVSINKLNSTNLVMDEECWTDVEYLYSAKPPTWGYAASKTLAEKTAWKYAEENKIDLITVIPSLMAGPSITPNVPSSICLAMSLITEEESASGRYICSPINTSFPELAKFLNKRYPQYKVPTDFGDFSANAKLILSSEKLTNEGFSFKYGIEDIYDQSVEYFKKVGPLQE
ncbi:hypothetical protein IFM89_016416 [Coptis chinensis]|uniref:Protein kinase domain-containing protein n=1 Tax=Coptis chinensis TaxID=261450 RepID=A0A835HBH3_9MAGN|nr:hypothetical protein IFM89_016416 [Coptis chinensis]